MLGTRKTSSEVAVDPEVHKMSLAETRRLLLWVSQGAPYQVTAVDGICKGLQAELKSLAGKGSDSDDEDGGDGGGAGDRSLSPTLSLTGRGGGGAHLQLFGGKKKVSKQEFRQPHRTI